MKEKEESRETGREKVKESESGVKMEIFTAKKLMKVLHKKNEQIEFFCRDANTLVFTWNHAQKKKRAKTKNVCKSTIQKHDERTRLNETNERMRIKCPSNCLWNAKRNANCLENEVVQFSRTIKSKWREDTDGFKTHLKSNPTSLRWCEQSKSFAILQIRDISRKRQNSKKGSAQLFVLPHTYKDTYTHAAYLAMSR